MIFTTNFEKDHGNPRQAAGTVDGICLEQNDKSVLTIPRAMKIDINYLILSKILISEISTLINYHGKLRHFFNKRGGDDIYNDE